MMSTHQGNPANLRAGIGYWVASHTRRRRVASLLSYAMDR